MSQIEYVAEDDFYQLLGLTPGATPEEINRAHKRLAKECHPDVHPDTEWATAQIKRLNEARRVLLDKDLKGQYDRLRWEAVSGDRLRDRPRAAAPAPKPPKGSGGADRHSHHRDRMMSYFIAGIEALVMLFFLVLGIYAALKKLNS